jgi:RNA polymerase sigma factor (sigma-70 family)
LFPPARRLAAAEDLTSATFLEAWRRRYEVQLAGDSIRPWLLGVATNLFRNDIRSRRRRDTALQKLGAVGDRPQDALADDVVGRMDDQRRMTALLEQLAKLPSEQQEVIALVLWSELKQDSIAVILDDEMVLLALREGSIEILGEDADQQASS